MFVRCLIIFVLVFTGCSSSDPAGQQATTSTNNVTALVAGYHFFAKKSDWQTLGSDASTQMMNAFDELREIPAWQAKVLHGLAYFDEPEVRAFVVAKAKDHSSSIVRREAITSSFKLLGAAAADELTSLLSDPDFKVRGHMLREFAALDRPELNERIKRHLQNEPSKVVRTQASKYLQRQFKAKIK